MRFAELVGQKELATKLRKGATSGRIPHAQLFLGAEGSGNLALTFAYAQYVMCTNRSEADSCGVCASCRKVSSLTHPDLHFSFPYPANKGDFATELYPEFRKAFIDNPYLNYEMWMENLDATGKQGNIPVKECHAILKNLSLKPFESEYKVLIMWLPEYLGNAGNVLLKSLEEPSQKTLFLLVGENTEKIITTILSRVQLIRVPPILNEDLADKLVESYNMPKEDALRLAVMSTGNLVKAIELAANAENHYLEPLRAWLGFCYQKQLPKAFDWADNYSAGGREQLKGFFLYSLEIIRAVLVYPVIGSNNGLNASETEFVAKFSSIINNNAKAELMYKWMNDAAYEVERNGSAKLIFADLSFKVARLLK